MRGDQLARQWRVIRAIEASSNGLTVTEQEKTGNCIIARALEPHQASGFSLYTQRVEGATCRAFPDTFKFKVPAHQQNSPLHKSIRAAKKLILN